MTDTRRSRPATPPPGPASGRRPVSERKAAGMGLRQRCPRKSHSRWKRRPARVDPIDLLIASSKGRIRSLIPLRYGRMMASPFAFFRGAAAIMAHDLKLTPKTGITVQACGDCHLLNFGGFATPERKVVFDINDFDETLPAPWEWDLRRLAASFVIAGRANRFAERDCREAAWWAVRRYRQKMLEYAAGSVLDTWYEALDLELLIRGGEEREFQEFNRRKMLHPAETGAHRQEFGKLEHEPGEAPCIRDDPPLVYHPEHFQHDPHYRATFERAFERYVASMALYRRPLLERFRIVDAAIKVVGVGSVGTYCGVLLLMSGNGEPLFLQYKEARASVLEPYAGASLYRHGGERVVVGQRIMQSASDLFLGWTTGERGRHVYVRQLHDVKIKPVIEVMKPPNLRNYAKACGWALARAHARTADAVELAAYMGRGEVFEDALADFATAYADQNERDHAALLKAIRSGRIEAVAEGA